MVWHQIETNLNTMEYSRVIMPLSALLEGEFFHSYIKAGTCSITFIISQGLAVDS